MEFDALSKDAARAVDLSDLFALLSMGFKSPTRELAGGVWDGSFFQDVNACCAGLGLAGVDTPGVGDAADAEALYHQINQEYTRLFLAPWKELIAICEGTFIHGKKTSQFINDTALHAEQCYRHAAYVFEEKGSLPGDHMSVELAFMAFLYANLGLGQQAEKADMAENMQTTIQEFSQKHLKRWFLTFMSTVADTTAHPFYQALAQVGTQLGQMLEL